jgi:hypothetical protein
MFCLEKRGSGKKGSGKGQRRDAESRSSSDTPQTAARKDALASAMRPLSAAPAINTRAESLDAQGEEAGKLAVRAGRYAARRGLVPVPTGLQGGEAEEYAQKKLVELLPEAVGNLEYDLKYGDDKARAEASHKVLAANGLANREQAGNMVPPIVLNFTGVLPWMQVPGVSPQTMKEVTKRAQIVDGETARSKDGESGTNGDRPRGSAQADGSGGQAD